MEEETINSHIIPSLNSLTASTHLQSPLRRSLVFHTYLPKQESGVGGPEADAPPLLAEYAPLLLRSLYERDVRCHHMMLRTSQTPGLFPPLMCRFA